MVQRFLVVFWVITLMVVPKTVLAVENPPFLVQPATLSLDQCVEIAFKNSQSIKAAAKSVEIARAAVKEVEGGFWPRFDYSLFANKAEEPLYPYPSFLFPYAATDYSGAVISLTQPLYLGGKLTAGFQLKKEQLNMAIENERKSRQQLAFQVKQAFYQVWLAEQALKIAQSSYDNLEHHVEQIESFYQEGAISKFELLRAKVQRDSLKPQVIAAQNGLKLAKLSMTILIGFPKDQPYSAAYDSGTLQIPGQSNISADQILESAFQNRPEMRQIKQAERMSQYQKKLAEAGHKPDIVLIGQYQGASQDYTPEHWNDSKLWTLTLSISGNIFDGFSTPAKITGARKNLELAMIQESGLRDQIKLEVEQSVQNIQESLEVIRANQSNIDMAKESLELTEARFAEGMATTMDVMDSQLALDHALNGYYQGIVLYLTAKAKLDLTIGKDG
jgi:outer membrane protein